MKRVTIVLIILFLATTIHSDEIVNIWADNSIEDFGVSRDRVWLKSCFLSNFEYYTTLKTETSSGVLTVVTVSRNLYFMLEELLKHDDSYTKDSVTISRIGNIYSFRNSKNSLEFSFSLEKPGEDIFNIINSIYKNDELNKQIVRDHYLESWVVRIHSAENVISPDINTLDFDDILITATIIGEDFQWLWGVHDGVDYVYKHLK